MSCLQIHTRAPDSLARTGTLKLAHGEVHIPKPEQAKPRRIEISAGAKQQTIEA